MEEIEKIWTDWKIEEQIGQSEFSKVYKAKRENFNQTFYSAIKVITIPKNGVQNTIESEMDSSVAREYYKEYVDDILKKITLLEELKGAKNIINIEDCKVIEEKEKIQWNIYLRMDLLKNTKKYFTENPPQVIDIINLALDISEALEICEKMNIIHGNIKPENIFVSKFKEYKLGDFKLAQKIGTETSTISKNDYLFSSPEVYRNYEPNTTSDIYSLGLVIYYLLNGNRIPFMPENDKIITPRILNEALLKRMKGEEIPKVENIPDDLYKILKKMCAFDQESRYQTITELKQELKNAQKSYERNIEINFETTVNIFSKRRAQQQLEQQASKQENNNTELTENTKKEIEISDKENIVLKKEEVTSNSTENEKIIKKEQERNPKKEKNKNKDKEKTKKTINYKIIVLVIAIIIVISLGSILIIKNFSTKKEEKTEQTPSIIKIVVPNVIDMDRETATNVLQQIGFNVEIEEIENQEIQSGNVITQSIEKNTEVEKGTTIKIQVAK